ncbi:EAL domain-containing protein [Nitrosophilus alvini]|uniref:bifunctional diguanylate cyclase/phosphodiesterase n=1 Tax=Nitrosophilus alvini TaxID=2714855 RepID=UPI00190B164D|nr:EAL domain-containing protein [Nitrosophilus alvini]
MHCKNIVVGKNDGIDGKDLEKFLNFSAVLIQVFAASEERNFIKRVLEEVKRVLPDSVVIGVSAESFICGTDIGEGEKILLSICGFENASLEMFYETDIKDSFEVGKKIGSKVSPDSKALITFIDSKINGDAYLEGIYSENRDLKIVGGAASTKSWKDSFIIFDTSIPQCGAVAVSVSGERVRVCNNFVLGWEPFGRKLTVTKAEGNRLDAVERVSPKKIFEHYLGKEVADALPGIGSAFSFIIERDGDYLPRGIIGVNGESFILAGNVKKGDRVYIGYANPHNIIHQNRLDENIYNEIGSAEVIFNYYCLGRKLFLPEKIVRYELEKLGRCGLLSGFFTLGEFCSTKSNYNYLNFSSSILALSEKEEKRPCFEKVNIPDVGPFGLIAQGLFHMIGVRSKELEKLAYFDYLTSLPNRVYFDQKLSEAIKNVDKNAENIAVMYIDLDRFKNVNDTIGHILGDKILKKVGKKLKSLVPEIDFLARFGGDEFIAMKAFKRSNIEEVTDLANTIVEILNEQIRIRNRVFVLGCSIGVAVYPYDGENAEELIKNADTAMYQAKLAGGNRYEFYRKDMTKEAIDRVKMDNDLRVAMQKEEFALYYQPIFDLKTGKIIAVEALVRWNHPKRGVLLPAYFLDFAEKSGVIHKLGDLVLKNVFNDLRRLKKRGINPPKINVNMSVKNLTDGTILEKISDYSNRYEISENSITIEVTETSIMKNIDRCIDTLNGLTEKGIEISIDDFGTGYSSLSYLKNLPVTSLKIDRVFVSEIPYCKNDIVIIEAILALADAMGLKVVAEGIETKEQEKFLIDSNCKAGQGFLYCKPVDFDKFSDMLKK